MAAGGLVTGQYLYLALYGKNSTELQADIAEARLPQISNAAAARLEGESMVKSYLRLRQEAGSLRDQIAQLTARLAVVQAQRAEAQTAAAAGFAGQLVKLDGEIQELEAQLASLRFEQTTTLP